MNILCFTLNLLKLRALLKYSVRKSNSPKARDAHRNSRDRKKCTIRDNNIYAPSILVYKSIKCIGQSLMYRLGKKNFSNSTLLQKYLSNSVLNHHIQMKKNMAYYLSPKIQSLNLVLF